MDPLIRWQTRSVGEAGYLGDQYIGMIHNVGRGRLLLHCVLWCERQSETWTPHTSREDAKAFAERRVIASLMAEITPERS